MNVDEAERKVIKKILKDVQRAGQIGTPLVDALEEVDFDDRNNDTLNRSKLVEYLEAKLDEAK